MFEIRRSAFSIPSNIAEGSERDTNRDSVRFVYLARGSLAELYTQVDVASEVGLLEADESRKWLEECNQISRMLLELIRARCRR